MWPVLLAEMGGGGGGGSVVSKCVFALKLLSGSAKAKGVPPPPGPPGRAPGWRQN